MATSTGDTFENWLLEKLSSVSSDFDTDVFISYIVSILEEEDDSDDEKSESVTELLSGVVDTDVAADTCKSIFAEWKVYSDNKTSNQVTEDMGDKLSEILGKQTLATVKEKTLTDEERARKNAILAQYTEVSDGEETDDDDYTAKHSSGDGLLAKNLNAEDVNKAEREMREKAKLESENKKDKDKQDRQAQKQKQQDRKDNEKKRTQKGERRR